MSRSSDSLFIGRLHKDTRVKDLEDIFETYGRIVRCDIKYGAAEMAYGFVDFEDRRDAEDALRYENGRSVCGSKIIVEWAKGKPRVGMGGGGGRERGDREFSNDCFNCHRPGHMARDCPDGQGGRGGGGRGGGGGYRSQQRDRSRSRDRGSGDYRRGGGRY